MSTSTKTKKLQLLGRFMKQSDLDQLLELISSKAGIENAVYVLKKGETLDDVPEGYALVYDPYVEEPEKDYYTTTEIPATVDYIGDNAFNGIYDKTSLTILKFRGVPTTISGNAFLNNTALANIYVPWAEGAVANAPWGAESATIHYNTVYDSDGNPIE